MFREVVIRFWCFMCCFLQFVPITARVTRALSKPHKVSHAYKPRASETRKIPRSNNMKTFRKKFPIILGFLRNNSVSKRFRYLGSGKKRKENFLIYIITWFSQIFGSRIWQRELNFCTGVSPVSKRYIMKKWMIIGCVAATSVLVYDL